MFLLNRSINQIIQENFQYSVKSETRLLKRKTKNTDYESLIKVNELSKSQDRQGVASKVRY